MEIKREVITYSVDLSCDVCEDAPTMDRVRTLLSYPPQYVYECNECKSQVTSRSEYPKLYYEQGGILKDG